ncbi:MAG: LuxR C-terminal-related transcriptional regulator [Bacteroidales bacterium]|nr:LuxR C-terminal-related transcriptional regulator [Bacteroidales bacterium]
MADSKKNVLLIVPSLMVAKGLDSILSDLGEFKVCGILSDLTRSSETRLKNMDVDIVIIDPQVFDYDSRKNARALMGEFTDAPVIAIETIAMGEEILKQFDEVVSIYDIPTVIIRKMRSALDARAEAPKAEGNELSIREKEILVCVAKGMLNKEIADEYNISIYTVITHRKNITRKTGIKTVAGLTVYALLNNLIDMNSVE